MPKFLIEDGLSLKQKRGIAQYTQRLFEVLSTNETTIMARKPFLEKIKNNIIRRITYALWLNTFFIIKLILLRGETICIFPATMTPFIKLPRKRYISIIHDIRSVEYPELSTKIQNIHANFVNWTAIKFSDELVTVSETMKNQISKYYEIDKNKIKIIYNTSSIQNINYDKDETILRKYALKPKTYLFFVGGRDKNKNIQNLISSFECINNDFPNLKLVIAGNKGNDKIISTNPNVIYTGFVSDEDIKVLYKNTLLFIFPSIYEGFGIPILDAQIMNVPVICSDIPVFREVAGEGALFCDINPESFSEGIRTLITNTELRENLVKKGTENIKRYSIERIKKQIGKILTTYKEG